MSPSLRFCPLNTVIGRRFKYIRLALIGDRLADHRLIDCRLIDRDHGAPTESSQQGCAWVVDKQVHVVSDEECQLQYFWFAQGKYQFLRRLLVVLCDHEHKVFLAATESENVGVRIANTLLHRRQVKHCDGVFVDG